MKWREEAQKTKIRRDIIEGRLAKLAGDASQPQIRRESIDDYLARGGKITKLPPKTK